MAKPVSSSRRSSISSVTSSGRRRKDQSLQDIATSLGQRTPERLQTSDEGISTRSRQLDFGGVDEAEQGVEDDNAEESEEGVMARDEEEVGEKRKREEPGTGDVELVESEVVVVQVNGEGEGEEEDEHLGDLSRRSRRGGRRRRTVWWTAEEENFLRRGVAKYGVGKWKKILIDGQNVFLSHRTNVDLKDKWKNLHLRRHTNRKRRREPDAVTPPHENSATKNSRFVRDDISEISSVDSACIVAPRSRRRVAVVADRSMSNSAKEAIDVESLPDEADEDYCVEEDFAVPDDDAASGLGHQSGPVVLKFATDKCFPELVGVRVDLDVCKNVSALKEELRSSILLDASPDAEVQVIGLKARLLFGDEEPLSQCIGKNGVEFFLVMEESPEEFV